MLRKFLVTLVLAVVGAASLDAELKYTVEMKQNKIENAPAASNQMLAMMGQQAMQQILPNGTAKMVYVVGANGIRTEFVSGGMGVGAGTVSIMKPNGDVFMLNPAAKTYWKTTISQAAGALAQAGVKPEVKVTRTGETATVGGLRTEKVVMDMTIPLPIPPEALSQLPPGFPTSISMQIDNWISVDRYKEYAVMASKGNSILQSFGIDASKVDGITMRALMRADIFGPVEIESLVTQIGEEAVPASMFEVPADYKLVAGPGGGIGG
jgi:hypothetical protein